MPTGTMLTENYAKLRNKRTAYSDAQVDRHAKEIVEAGKKQLMLWQDPIPEAPWCCGILTYNPKNDPVL